MKKLLVFILLILLLGFNSSDIETSHAYIFMEEDQIMFDRVEYIGLEDESRMDESALNEYDMPNGYYLYNELEKKST